MITFIYKGFDQISYSPTPTLINFQLLTIFSKIFPLDVWQDENSWNVLKEYYFRIAETYQTLMVGME